MNHKCHGDYVQDARLYRCLYDSTIIQNTDLPEVCPVCNRDVRADIHPTARRFTKRQRCIEIAGVEFVISEEVDDGV